MKISRWIYVPLFLGLLFVLPQILFGTIDTFTGFIKFFSIGVIFGFVIQLWSDIRARRISNKDSEEIYKLKQNRTLTLLTNYEKAFELCREAVDSLNPAKIKTASFENGIIEARTRMKLTSNGNIIQLNLRKISENLTEIEISTRPRYRGTLVDFGEGWKYAEDICKYLKVKEMELNKKVLTDNSEFLDNVYVEPFQKENIERR